MIRFDIRRYDRLGSTNDEARRLAETDAPNGTVVVAREQIAGRGRRGRSWSSPPGNLYLSILLRLDLPAARIAELSFVTALAVADTVDYFISNKAVLKWPNDVLVDGAKISGILLERADAAVVVGIGLNVLHVPPDATAIATSLMQAGAWHASDFGEPSARVAEVQAALLQGFVGRVAAWQDGGFDAVRDAWLARAHPTGTVLRMSLGTGSVIGTFVGLGCDGALLLESAGSIRRITAGDVALVAYEKVPGDHHDQSENN
ncbi:MAG: biotin--[acetyl-CoA-carboxylase] ligase [Acetobacteraceae bacterium]